MQPGEFAIHYSTIDPSLGAGPVCTIVFSLPQAIDYAEQYIARNSAVRCRVYDHEGFVGSPLYELKGASYKGESEMSPRFRRWAGSILFFGGLVLTAIDWHSGFRLSWPALVGTRMIFPGLILLFIEAMVMLTARQKAWQRPTASGESWHHDKERAI